MEAPYDPRDLAKFPDIGALQPELAQAFLDDYPAGVAHGALSAREEALLARRRIRTARHGFGCTTGAGSSCCGTLT